MMKFENTYQLKNIGLPALKSIDELADAMRLSKSLLLNLSYQSDCFYKTYKIEKKPNGYRTIAQPSRKLKAIQGWILRNILDRLSSSKYSKGFEKGSSILENAKPHIGANYILNVDLENFFPTISAEKVFGIFNSIGYSKTMAAHFTNFCVFNGYLPQGAPTSPKLANLICAKLDARISCYSGSKGITYTRYADDLTLSANSPKKIYKALEMIKVIVSDENFVINEDKTKILGTRHKKEVTGLVLSTSKVGIGRQNFRKLRAEIHSLAINKSERWAYVSGYLSYVYSVDKSTYNKLKAYIKKLGVNYDIKSFDKKFNLININ